MEKKAAASIEITVISAEDLRIDNRPVKKNVFVTVGTSKENWRSTKVDRDGGSYPLWNEKLELLDLPPPAGARSIAVQVQCKTAGVIKMVGRVDIPVSDIVEGYVPPHLLHFLSYRLRDRSGHRNGIINLSIRMVGSIPSKFNREMASSSSSSSSNSSYISRGSGIVIGVPITSHTASKSMQY